MIVNVFREGADKNKKKLVEITESDTVEIQRIKELMKCYNLDYISDNIRHILDITKENNIDCFNVKNNVYRVVEGDQQFRVIFYIRLSVEDGDIIDGDVSKSIRNQLLYLLTECKNKNWNLVAIFCEEGISGADDNRPEWLKALTYCEYGNTEIFLCKSQSRFSRSMEMIEKYLHKEFVKWNIRFVGLVDNTDTSVQGNKKTRQINGLVNEWMVEDQSINTRKILRNKKMNGLYTGSFAPYGYIKDPKDRYHLIIDEPAAKIVRRIFKMYANGEGYYKICRTLNEENVPTPTEYKKLNGSNFYSFSSTMNKRITYQIEREDTLEKIAVAFHSVPKDIIEYNNLKTEELEVGQIIIVPCRSTWHYDIVRKILIDETYIGTLVQGKVQRRSYKDKTEVKIPEKDWIRVPHCHNAVIDKETWEIVSDRFKNRGRIKPIKDGNIHIFSKKVYCDCCGKIFQRNLCRVKGGKRAYLSCRERKRTGAFICNNNTSVRYDDLENMILDQINNQIKKYYELSKVKDNYNAQKIEEDINQNVSILETEKKQCLSMIQKKQHAIAMLYDDRINGIIEVSDFSMIKSQYTVDIASYKKRVSQIDKDIIDLEEKRIHKKNQELIFKKYKKINKLTRFVIDEFINKIYIGKVDENKTRKIRIEWNLNLE